MQNQKSQSQWNELQEEKRLSRAADEALIASGQKSGLQVRRENGIFSGFRVEIDLKGAKRLW